MYVIIVGAGRVGTALARWLLEAEQEVTLIERDPERCATAEDELGSVTVCGDATESGVLRTAGVARAEAVVATGRRDDENLVVCQMAKHLFNVQRVMATVNVSEHADLFRRLGIDTSIDTTMLLVEAFQENLGGLLAEEIGGL